jgi:Mlc titration factor MtfA (ptsG expression regulator)
MKSLTSILRNLAARLTRVRLPTDPIPPIWPQLVDRHVPLIARLSSADRDRLFHIMQLFLKEVPFETAGGLELREEIQVTIAAQACLLLLKMPYPRYARVRRVLVYPAAFMPKTQHSYRSNQLVTPDEPAAGQAWPSGVVVLGWEDVKGGALAGSDGHNVVFHEFAHMLDAEDGTFDGTPVLDSASSYHAWVTQWSAEFDEHVRRVEADEATLLDPYGATNRAEFFAVATEAFFERPLEVRSHQPRLYTLLAEFFKLDPAVLLRGMDAQGPQTLFPR